MLTERSPDEQSDVGPTLASNVGPTELTTLSQRWANVVMLSGLENIMSHFVTVSLHVVFDQVSP